MATLRYLDTLYEKGDMERSQYFKKNLALVITKLPKVIYTCLPSFLNLFSQSFCLFDVLLILSFLYSLLFLSLPPSLPPISFPESHSPEGNSGSKTRIQKQQDGSVCLAHHSSSGRRLHNAGIR